MRRLLLSTAILLSLGGTAPAMAQSRQAQARFDAAQSRYQAETARYRAELDLYERAVGYDGQGYRGAPPPPPPGDDRYENGYDPAGYYRDDPRYQERVLSPSDRVYRGSDDRYYCKRNDGTTGLIVGGAGGGILGNVIAGGHSRTVGTLLGGAIGALAGRAVDRNSNGGVTCR